MGLSAQLRAGRTYLVNLFPARGARLAVAELGEVAAELETLNRTTEADFLAVGGKLMAFLTSARELHSGIQTLSALVGGERSQDACQALVSVRGFVDHMRQRLDETARSLEQLRAAAGRIRGRFATFGRIAMSFHITAILARIETSHLARSSEDLGNLAAEVRSSSDAIQTRAAEVVEAAAALDVRVAATLREVSRLDAIQRSELPALLGEVDADLEQFRSRQQIVAQASSSLTAHLESVTGELGAITTSLQFHDITRQQVEHVVEALSELSRRTNRGSLPPGAGQVLRVQSAQLKSAAAAFTRSTEKIDQDLERISARVEAMAAESALILGSGEGRQDSFLAGMQQRLAVILKTVQESRACEQSAAHTLGELDGLSRRLHSAIVDVQAIEVQLSRISINAAVSASHVGAPGEPLNVVAGAVQALQLECAAHSREAQTDLGCIQETMAGSSGGSPAAAGRSDGALFEELNRAILDLQAANSSGGEMAGGIVAQSRKLCENLQDARRHSGIGRRFAETAERCRTLLDGLAVKSEPDGATDSPAFEGGFEERYTMHVERDIHRAVAGGVEALEAAAPGAEEDVEFF